MRFVFLLSILSLACGSETGSVRSSGLAPASSEALGRIPEGIQLSREEIVAGMERAKSGVHDCQAELGSSGPAEVRTTVVNGRVSQARALKVLSGTPAGACIENVVEQAAFPAGKHRTFDYIFSSK
jgi:hypothetical protein